MTSKTIGQVELEDTAEVKSEEVVRSTESNDEIIAKLRVIKRGIG